LIFVDVGVEETIGSGPRENLYYDGGLDVAAGQEWQAGYSKPIHPDERTPP
jgi:hypothetical protein